MYLSHNLKALRKQKQWTQQQLAERVGVKRSLIGSYEEGRAEPKLDTLLALSEVFQVTLDRLVHIANDFLTKRRGRGFVGIRAVFRHRV